MSLKRRGAEKKATSKSDVTFTNLPEGEVEGRLVYVADLGLQERSYMGDVKDPCQQLSLGIEIVDHPHMTDEGTMPRLLWTKPFNVFYKMNEKGKEFQFYRVFDTTAKPDTVADWDSQLGKACSVVITHFKKDDACYDNISNIASIPAKYQGGVAQSTIEPAIGDADDEENPATKALYGLAKYIFDKRLVEDDEPASDNPNEDDRPW